MNDVFYFLVYGLFNYIVLFFWDEVDRLFEDKIDIYWFRKIVFFELG